MHDEVHLARADQPPDEAQKKTRRHTALAAVGGLHGEIDRFGAAEQLRPVPLARKPSGRAHQLGKQAAPLRPVEPRQAEREHTAGDVQRRAHIVLRNLAGPRAQQRHAEKRE